MIRLEQDYVYLYKIFLFSFFLNFCLLVSPFCFQSSIICFQLIWCLFKNRERLLACMGGCLKYTKFQLTDSQWKAKEALRLVIKTLKVDILNLSEQQMFQELRKVSYIKSQYIVGRRKPNCVTFVVPLFSPNLAFMRFF